jgi:hypothetical protein
VRACSIDRGSFLDHQMKHQVTVQRCLPRFFPASSYLLFLNVNRLLEDVTDRQHLPGLFVFEPHLPSIFIVLQPVRGKCDVTLLHLVQQRVEAVD